PANAGANHHTGGTAIVLSSREPAGVLDRLGARDHCHMDEAVHLLLVFDGYPLADVEVAVCFGARRNLTGDLARQIRGIERLNRTDTGLGVDQASPDMLKAQTKGAD